jgi:acyl-CoA thioester hydrolase
MTSADAAADATPGPLLASIPLEVRWRDLDAFNHVNNAQYLSYIEEARLKWMLGLDGPWMDETSAPVIAAAQLDYRRPIGWPATIAVELRAQRVGRSSVTLAHRIVEAADASVVYSEGTVAMVWMDRATGRGATLPAVVRAACEAVAAG